MAKLHMYQRLLSALEVHPAGLNQPHLVVVMQADAWIPAKSVSTTLQKFARVGWAVNEAGIWTITVLGRTALEAQFSLHLALLGVEQVKPEPQPVVVPSETSRVFKEIDCFSQELPSHPVGLAWLYQVPAVMDLSGGAA